MLRLTEIRLPIDHSDRELEKAILNRLSITEKELDGFTVYRRNYDARKKTAIVFSYTVDAEVANEATLLKRFDGHPHIRKAPDMEYKFVAHAPDKPFSRPIVVGCGPCGLFAALILAQSGFKPVILERGKKRPGTYQRHVWLLA